MTSVRLNIFQRLVRQWDSLHPYNAAQVLRIAGLPDLLSIRRAWQATLSVLRLGPARVVGREFRFEAVNGNADQCDVPVCPAGVSVEEHLSHDLNRPFTDPDLPFRPFVIAEENSYYFGVVYHHWIADSASIRLLLREWFVRIYDPAKASDLPAIVPHGGYWSHFGPQRSRWRLGGQLLSLFRSASRFRRVRKIRTQGSPDFRMRFMRQTLPSGLLQQLLGVARRNHVTLNDLFLAAIADVCDRFNPTRDIPRRKDLALGMIVDLRSRSRRDMSRIFGLFLGFANIICRHEDFRGWPRLVRQISRQTRIHKETDSPQASAVWMFAALTASQFVPADKTFRFYRKHMPLSGGISNVNLNATWAAAYHPDMLLDYIRVSPIGPMVPLVFTPTTLGEELNFGLTYRAALFPDELAERMAATFKSRLIQLAECGDALLRE